MTFESSFRRTCSTELSAENEWNCHIYQTGCETSGRQQVTYWIPVRQPRTAEYLKNIAVRVGGGCNHRYNLSDGVLLKDNHIGAAGSVTKAIQMAKAYAPFVRKIEIEVETLEQVKEAVEAGADIIMLDNMTPEVMKQAVELINGRAQTECSGNITKENIQKIREIGVDFVSSGALTHSAPILDISMKNLHAV